MPGLSMETELPSIKRDFIRNAHAGESDPVEVRLTLSLGKQELNIFRAMKGKGLMPEAFLILDGQRIAAGTKEVDLRLEEILKISYQDFMKTFYARQKDLDNLLKEGGVGKREYILEASGAGGCSKREPLKRSNPAAPPLEEQKSRLEGALAEVGDVNEPGWRAPQGIFWPQEKAWRKPRGGGQICRKKWKRDDRSWRP